MTTADTPEPAELVKDPSQAVPHLQAEASDTAHIYQAARDLHMHYQDHGQRARRAAGPVVEECPYPGLATFSAQEADWYFGRDRLVAELVGRVAASVTDHRPVIVVAPSGSGKSSLLQAGLLSAITRGALPMTDSRSWPQVLLTPTAHPMRTLIAHLVPLVGEDAEDLATVWTADPEDGRTRFRRTAHTQTSRGSQRVILVADQLEEIFTLCQDEQERRQFLSTLEWLANPDDGADPGALVVLGLRADFYADCADYPWLRTAVQTDQLFLGPMSHSELREAIVFPAQAVGLEIEPGLVDVLLRDLGGTGSASGIGSGTASYESGRLPLLAHALRATWQQRHGHLLTLDGYRATGGIENAVATTAERVFARLDTAGQNAARNVFLRLVMVGEGADDSRRRVLRSDLVRSQTHSQSTQGVIDTFTRARLLIQDRDSVVITHEALLHAWPRLHKWINDDRVGNLIRQELHDDAAAWDRGGRMHDALYRKSQLDSAMAAVAKATGPGDVEQVTRAFLANATRWAQRTARIRRSVVAALAVLVLGMTAATWFALQQRSSALTERDAAIANQVTVEANQLRSSDPSLAAQLDLVANRLQPHLSAAYTNLITDDDTPLSANLDIAATPDAFSPDGAIMAGDGGDGTIRLWNLANPSHPTPLGKPLTKTTAIRFGVAFGPAGRALAAGDNDGTIRLWNLADPSHPTSVDLSQTGDTSDVFTVTFSPNGQVLAAGRNEHGVWLWNLADPSHPVPMGQLPTGVTDGISTVAFSSNGRILAAGGFDGTIRLWNMTDPSHPIPLEQPLSAGTNIVWALAFSPDGHILASGSEDRVVRLWNMSDPSHPALVGTSLGHGGSVHDVAFSQDGRTLASAGADGVIRLWSLADPTHPVPLGQPLGGATDPMAFGSDGRTLVSGGYANTIRLWNLPNVLVTGLTPNSFTANEVAFSADFRTLVTGSNDGTIRLWNLSDPTRPTSLGQPLTTYRDSIDTVAIGPDSYILAAGYYDGTIRLWNLSDPTHPTLLGQPLTSHRGNINAVTFSPDGRTLAVGDDDGTGQLWNLADPSHPALLSQLTATDRTPVYRVAFSPNGNILTTGGASTIQLWNLADPTHPAALGKPLTGYAGVFSSDGFTLAVSDGVGTIQLWDVTDPTHPTPLSQPLAGNTDILTVVFSPDGHTLAAGDDDGTIQLWNLADPSHSPIGQPLTGHTGAVVRVAFSPDGHFLASASYDGTIRLWDMNTSHAIQRICDATGKNLTLEQWHTYIAQLPYNPPCG